MIPYTPAASSTIERAVYDPAKSELHIEFKSGGIWIYSAISPEEWDALVTAASAGKHFYAHIRGKKEGRKHEPEPKPEAAADGRRDPAPV